MDLYWLLHRVHGALMGTSFVLLFIGMFFPRYLKKKKWWLKAHRRIGISGAVIGALSGRLEGVLDDDDLDDAVEYLLRLLGDKGRLGSLPSVAAGGPNSSRAAMAHSRTSSTGSAHARTSATATGRASGPTSRVPSHRRVRWIPRPMVPGVGYTAPLTAAALSSSVGQRGQSSAQSSAQLSGTGVPDLRLREDRDSARIGGVPGRWPAEPHRVYGA